MVRCVLEVDEDITAPRVPVGSPRAWALTGLAFLILGLLFIYAGLSGKGDDISQGWMLIGLGTSALGGFTLLLALFWGETLRKYREERARRNHLTS